MECLTSIAQGLVCVTWNLARVKISSNGGRFCDSGRVRLFDCNNFGIGRVRAFEGSRRTVMKLEIQERENEGILILDLKGRLVLGPEDSALRQRLQALAVQHNVIVNLKDISDIDSTGLGTLVNSALRFREAGGKLVLLNLNDSKGRLPDILKLNTVFETYQDEVAAVNSFFPDRTVLRYDILSFVEEQEQQEKT
jgi:anti-anti-sigma factor